MGGGVIPGLGFSSGGFNTTAASTYRHLGPVSPGVLLGHLDVSVVVSGGTVVGFSAVLIQSPDENVTTFQSGSAVISPGGATQDGKPAFGVTFAAAEVWRFVVPIGILVVGGPVFVLCALSSTAGGITALWNLTLFTMRRAAVPEEVTP